MRTAKAIIAHAHTGGKPVTHLITSHNHFDDVAGLRQAVAEGLTIVQRRSSEPQFRDMVAHAAPDFLDDLARMPKPLKFQAVDEHLRMSDDIRRRGEAPHAHIAARDSTRSGEHQHQPKRATAKLLVSVSTFADEMERERSRQRTYDALARKVQAGYVAGGRCFGYRNVRESSGVRREIEPGGADVVRQIFELAPLGVGYKGISKRLNDERAVCPRAQRGRPAGWAPSSVREVLKRSVYRGEIVWNQSRKRDSWGQHRQTLRPEGQWVRIPAPHLQVVADDLWDAAQRQLQGQRMRTRVPIAYHGPKRAKSTYLLTGLLKCGVCGAGMEVRRQKHGRVRVTILHCSAHWRRERTFVGTREQSSWLTPKPPFSHPFSTHS